jgi:hypothetical protein
MPPVLTIPAGDPQKAKKRPRDAEGRAPFLPQKKPATNPERDVITVAAVERTDKDDQPFEALLFCTSNTKALHRICKMMFTYNAAFWDTKDEQFQEGAAEWAPWILATLYNLARTPYTHSTKALEPWQTDNAKYGNKAAYMRIFSAKDVAAASF